MNRNDVLRRVRYTFELDDAEMIRVFALAGRQVTRAQVSDWLRRDEDPAFVPLEDVMLATFLNGFIVKMRGRREGPQPIPETTLNNNVILTKLKIALDIQGDEMLELVCSRELALSPHELSAFFRKPGHKHYRECLDQVLRNFLQGMQERYRATPGAGTEA